ncbi:MAG: hypothetical protein R2725_15260 [Solirubrobacterales bacterium]
MLAAGVLLGGWRRFGRQADSATSAPLSMRTSATAGRLDSGH